MENILLIILVLVIAKYKKISIKVGKWFDLNAAKQIDAETGSDTPVSYNKNTI